MSLKSFYFCLVLAAVFGKVVSACARMQRRVNRTHTNLTERPVKRPGLDW
jgi:hypothetical protein